MLQDALLANVASVAGDGQSTVVNGQRGAFQKALVHCLDGAVMCRPDGRYSAATSKSQAALQHGGALPLAGRSSVPRRLRRRRRCPDCELRRPCRRAVFWGPRGVLAARMHSPGRRMRWAAGVQNKRSALGVTCQPAHSLLGGLGYGLVSSVVRRISAV